MKQLEATLRATELLSPSIGWFSPALAVGALVRAGDAIGRLEILGAERLVVAPPGTHGVVTARAGLGRVAVDHGGTLYTIDPDVGATTAAVSAAEPTAATTASGLVFAAPMSGRFYGRPGPGKPPFVTAGDVIATGHTVCLLEVMKTFNRVTYGGPGLPARARVTEVLIGDEGDVDAGTPLLRIEPAT